MQPNLNLRRLPINICRGVKFQSKNQSLIRAYCTYKVLNGVSLQRLHCFDYGCTPWARERKKSRIALHDLLRQLVLYTKDCINGNLM